MDYRKSKSRLREIYESTDSMKVRDETYNVCLWSVPDYEYMIYKNAVKASMSGTAWKDMTKLAILGAGDMYAYVADRKIDKLSVIYSMLLYISGFESSFNVSSDVLEYGHKRYQFRTLIELVHWVDKNIAECLNLSRSVCFRTAILMGVCRADKEGIVFPEFVIDKVKYVEDRFANYVSKVEYEYENAITYLLSKNDDMLRTVDLKKYWGNLYDMFIEVAEICGFEYK